MKKKLVILTLIIALLCLPLIACGGEKKAPTNKKVNLTEYATPLDYTRGDYEPYRGNTLFTKADKLLSGNIVKTNDFGVALVRNSENKYSFFDLNISASLLEGATYALADFADYGFIVVGGTELGQQALYTPFGAPVVSMSKFTNLSFTKEYYYLAGKYTGNYVYVVSYLPEGKTDEDDTVKKYYVYAGETIKDKSEFKEVDFANLRKTVTANTIGSTINALSLTPVNLYGLGDTADYVYGAQINATYEDTYNGIVTYYKDGKETGSFAIKNGSVLGTVGKYTYYYEVDNLPYDAKKGYNVYTQTGENFTSAKKENYTYYRYDILKNKSSKYNPGYFITGHFKNVLFNYNTEQSDAAIVTAINYVDGVASVTSTTPYRTYVVDSNLKVVADLTDKPYTFDYGATKLKDDRILVRGAQDDTYYIINNKLEIVASFATAEDVRFNLDKTGIITYQMSESEYSWMAIDFDGKVVLEPKYNNLGATFGGYAITEIENESGKYFSVSSDNANGTEFTKSATEVFLTNYVSKGIMVKRNMDTGNVVAYNAKGDAIATISGASSVSNFNSSNGIYYIIVNLTAGGQETYILG